jgi:uncharacterized protein (TIGR02246 family)
MSLSDAADVDRAAIQRTTAQLLAAVNDSDVEGCAAVWAVNAVLMPPHHPAVSGQPAITQYFRGLFSRTAFRFTFTSSGIRLAGDSAFECVTYTATIRPNGGAPPIDDIGKGLHVYERQQDGSWKLTLDIWNSDRAIPS